MGAFAGGGCAPPTCAVARYGLFPTSSRASGILASVARALPTARKNGEVPRARKVIASGRQPTDRSGVPPNSGLSVPVPPVLPLRVSLSAAILQKRSRFEATQARL